MTSPDSPSSGPVGERAARRRNQSGAAGVSRAAIGGVVAVALLAAGGTAWAITQGSGESTPVAGASSTATSAPATSDGVQSSQPSAGSSASSSTGPSASSSSTSQPVPAAFTACKSEVASGDALARVGTTLAANWRDHTSSQARVDAGQISASQAQAVWDRTRKAGPSDVKKFQAASAAYEKRKGSCAGMGEVPPEYTQAASKCTQHAKANGQVATALTPVAASWAGHLNDMKVKANTPVGAYMEKWRGQVGNAPQAVKNYSDAVTELRKSPGCPAAS